MRGPNTARRARSTALTRRVAHRHGAAPPPRRGPRPEPKGPRSDDADVLSLRAFLALRDLELDPLVFLEGPVTTGLDSGEMHEHVIATPVLGDKPEALIRVEPLHRALRHSHSPVR